MILQGGLRLGSSEARRWSFYISKPQGEMGFVFAEGDWTRGDSRVLPYAHHTSSLSTSAEYRARHTLQWGRAKLDGVDRQIRRTFTPVGQAGSSTRAIAAFPASENVRPLRYTWPATITPRPVK